MLSFLPPIAFTHPVPALAWRGDTGFCHADEITAADVVRHEQTTRGHLLDASAALIAFLADFHAASLLWVTFTREDAARYGRPLPVRIDEPAYVIADDDHGGILIFFCGDPTTTEGGISATRTMPAAPDAALDGSGVNVAPEMLALATRLIPKAKTMTSRPDDSDRADLTATPRAGDAPDKAADPPPPAREAATQDGPAAGSAIDHAPEIREEEFGATERVNRAENARAATTRGGRAARRGPARRSFPHSISPA